MSSFLKIVILMVFAVSPALTRADGLDLEDIEADDLEAIVEDFSSVFSHSSVSPASSLGTIFGFELGLIGGMVTTDNIKDISEESDPDSDVSGLPTAAIYGALSVPLGLTAEVGFIPSLDGGDVSLDKTALSLKWTMTETVLPLPVDVALRGHLTKANLEFTQDLGAGVDADVKYTSTLMGAQVVVSKSFIVVEPYAGFGMLKADGELSYDASSGTIFDPSLTTSDKASKELSGTEWFLGAQLNLLIFRLGLEYGQVFDATRILGKLSLKF